MVTPRAWFVLVQLGAALALASQFSAPPGSHAASEVDSKARAPTALFTGVVASLADSSKSIVQWLTDGSDAKLTIEPRPLRTRPTGGVDNAENDLMLAGSTDSIPSSELAARVRVIDSVGLARGDVSVFQRCPGRLAGTPNHPPPPDPWKACPPSGTIVAALGVLSGSDTESRVEVVVLAAQPEKSALINVLTMKPEHGRWRLAKQKSWVIVE